MHTKQAAVAFDKKGVVRKTIQVGSSTLLSRLTGLVREILLVKFLGAGALSDAFFTAYKIPNSLRKIFAEGALSSALVPTLVGLIKKDRRDLVSSLMSLTFLVFESILVALCLFIFWNAELVVRCLAPGWYLEIVTERLHSAVPLIGWIFEYLFPACYVPGPNPEIAQYAINYLKLLFPVILFFSSGAILAGALQSVHHFFIPAIAPVLFNIVYITGLLSCLRFGLSVNALCYCLLIASLFQFLLHIYMYFKLNFSFARIDQETRNHFRELLIKFVPFLFSMSIMEVNLAIITTVATYLPHGSISFLNYANRFMGIPLGVFATAFSTILLPYFSRVSTYAPKRLSVYLLEAAKVVFWITMPAMIMMMLLSEKIFHTLFLSEKFTVAHVAKASDVLMAFLAGLFFFSLYKIILNLFYSLKGSTSSIIIVSLSAIVANYTFGKLLMPFCGAVGLALAMVLSCVIQIVLLLWFLYKHFALKIYMKPFLLFMIAAGKQMSVLIPLFVLLYQVGIVLIGFSCPSYISHFLLYKVGFWLWAGPLCCFIAWLFYRTRKTFALNLYFLD